MQVDSKNCAFITYTTRSAAEKASEELTANPTIKGVRCKLMWGRPPPAPGTRPVVSAEDVSQPSTAGCGAPGPVPPHMLAAMGGTVSAASPSGPNYFNLPPGHAGYYPSMDPQAMGSRIAPDAPAAAAAAAAPQLPGSQARRPGQDTSGADGMEGQDAQRSRGPPPPSSLSYGVPTPYSALPTYGTPQQYGAPPPGYHPGMGPPTPYGAPTPMVYAPPPPRPMVPAPRLPPGAQ